MSDNSEKLEPVRTSEGRARATYVQIVEGMWGEIRKDGDKLYRTLEGRTEVWLWVSGRGKLAIYEREDGGEQ